MKLFPHLQDNNKRGPNNVIPAAAVVAGRARKVQAVAETKADQAKANLFSEDDITAIFGPPPSTKHRNIPRVHLKKEYINKHQTID